jgi:hypothetical protein
VTTTNRREAAFHHGRINFGFGCCTRIAPLQEDRWQCDRLFFVGIRLQRKMARTTQANRPLMTRVGVLRDSSNPSGIGLLAAIQGASPALDVEVSPLGVREVGEIERRW